MSGVDNNRWKYELFMSLIGFISIGITILTVLSYFIDKMKDDPYLMFGVLVCVLVIPSVCYVLGRHHGEKKAHETYQHVMNKVVESMTGKPSVIDVTPSKRQPFKEPPRPIIVNRQLDNNNDDRDIYNYRRVLLDMVRFGYPYFTRDTLRARGAYMGANENYTELTAWLSANKKIKRVSWNGNQAWEWADPDGGRRIGIDELNRFIVEQSPD